MIDVKQAAQIAIEYFRDLYSDQDFSNVFLEEVDVNKLNQNWLITIGYNEDRLASILGHAFDPSSNNKNRRYKIFEIDAETGKVHSMKIRTLENA